MNRGGSGSNSHNNSFLESLRTSIDETKEEFDRNRRCEIPETANGRLLMRVLGKMVLHKFSKADKNFWFKILSKKRGLDISIKCMATDNQPGNGFIEDYPRYTEVTFKDFSEFSDYFDNFLRNGLSPPGEGAVEEVKWKVSVLLLFEIVRRMPEKDVHHDLPVASAIQMAMKLRYLPATKLFDVFRNGIQERRAAYEEIKSKYFHEHPKVEDKEAHLARLVDVFLRDSEDDVDRLARGLKVLAV